MRLLPSLLAATLCTLSSLPVLAEQPDPSEPSAETAEQAPAATAADPASLPDDEEQDEAEPPALPPAADSLGGHLVASGSAALALPFGELQDGLLQSDVMGSGYAFGLELGYGVSRTVVLGAWGRLAGFGSSDSCSDCSTTSYSFGPFVRYHLVQGVRFDPWLSAGVGLVGTTIRAGSQDLAYFGLELLRLQVGGDWYAWKSLGFGPFLELDTGWYYKRPDDLTAVGYPSARDSGALYHCFSIGARITFDTPGK